jgi:hypothetical protein
VFNGLQFSDNIYEAYSKKFYNSFSNINSYFLYKLDINIIDTIYCSNDELVKDKLINTTQNFNLDLNNSISIFDKSVEKIVDSTSTLLKDAIIPVVNQIGLASAMGVIATATATALKSITRIPTTRVALVITAGVLGGPAHVANSALYKNLIKNEKLRDKSDSSSSQFNLSSTSNKISNSNSEKSEDFLIPTPNETTHILYDFIDNHPVDTLLYSILIMNIISLFLMFNLSILLLFKLISKSTLEFKFIDKIMSEKDSTIIKYYINKILKKF